MNKEIGIILAAGLGTRMKPITDSVPKPLVRVFDKPMIETVIDGLLTRNITEIYIVVGYLKKQFDTLKEKYPQIYLIENNDYLIKNNISSIYAVKDILKSADCFICEADLLILDTGIFNAELKQSCYFGKKVDGYSDDWIFELENERIVKIKKGGTDVYNMVGVSYFKRQDACVLAETVVEMYKDSKNDSLFWDEAVDNILDKINLTINPVFEGQIVEIDTVEELNEIRSKGVGNK